MIVLISVGLAFLFCTFVLRVVAGFTPGFELEDWSATMVAALILTILHEGLVFLWPAAIDLESAFPWKFHVAAFVVNIAGLGFASLTVGGVRIRGAGSLIVSAVLITIFGYATALAVAQVMARVALTF